jgi:DNA-binding LacI/PurR family transcriptional regulator
VTRRRSPPEPSPGWASSRPTIQDVAALSNVSKTTVSNVIRDSGRVSDATRRRVLDAVETLGFRPSGLARNLVSRHATTIGVVVGDLSNTFYAELVRVIERGASRLGYTTMVCNTDGHPELETARIETLLEQGVSGIAMLQFSGDGALLDELAAVRLPVVVVSCWDDRADCVAVDDVAGMQLAVEHLFELGHERIAYATGPLVEDATHAARFSGYREAMVLHGLQTRLVDAALAPDGVAGAAPLADAVRGEDAVTAIVTANDLMAIGLIAALERSGARVPDDVSIVGFDGISLGAHSRISLTTIAQPSARMAQQGVELLVRRITSPGEPGLQQVRLDPELIRRGSTAPPPGAR